MKNNINWNAVSALTAIIALIATVVISSYQINRSKKLLMYEIESSAKREKEQKNFDSIKYFTQLEISKEQFRIQKIVDSLHFAKQIQLLTSQFSNQRKFDSISIERQLDTIYSQFNTTSQFTLKQLNLAERQITEQKELALKQIETYRQSIYFQDNQKILSTLESLLKDLYKKENILHKIVSNLDQVNYFGDASGRESGQQSQIYDKKDLLDGITAYSYIIQNRLNIDYALKQDTLLLNQIDFFYRNLFIIRNEVEHISLGGFRHHNAGYYEAKVELLKLQPLYTNLNEHIIPEIRQQIYKYK